MVVIALVLAMCERDTGVPMCGCAVLECNMSSHSHQVNERFMSVFVTKCHTFSPRPMQCVRTVTIMSRCAIARNDQRTIGIANWVVVGERGTRSAPDGVFSPVYR